MVTENQQTAFGNSALKDRVDILAPAKINLFLEVRNKRSDGFHELETVMATVSLYDHLRFMPRDDDQINLSIVNQKLAPNKLNQSGPVMNQAAIPLDQRNLIVQALMRLRDQSSIGKPLGCDVVVQKNIPSSAGLGGASSNAAAAIKAGCELWKLNVPFSRQLEIAADLGSDIPFFLFGGTAVCRGRGEQIQPLIASCGLPVVIAKPVTGLSTPEVFKRCRPPNEPLSATAMIQGVPNLRPQDIAGLLFNRLQKFAVELNPGIAHVASEFPKTNCLGHQMSGSGSSYFGVFASHRAARQAAQVLSARLPKVKIFCAQTSGGCPQLQVGH